MTELESAPGAGPDAKRIEGRLRWAKLLPWLITLACFTYLYFKLSGAAAREGRRGGHPHS